MLENLKNEVCQANLQLKSSGLVIQTWGNVSGIDRQKELVVIKPSGLGYDQIQPDAMVVVSLKTGRVIVECLSGIDPMEMPAVLVANHGPFTWGQTPAAAHESGIVLEEVARIAKGTIQINPSIKPIESHYMKNTTHVNMAA